MARDFLPLIVCTAFERNWGGVFKNAMVFLSGTLSQNLDSEISIGADLRGAAVQLHPEKCDVMLPEELAIKINRVSSE